MPQPLRQTPSAEDLFDFFYIDPQGREWKLTGVYKDLTPGFFKAIREDGSIVTVHGSTLQYKDKNGTDRNT